MRKGIECPFCPEPTTLMGGGEDKTRVEIRDHFRRQHGDVPQERKLAVVRALRLRPFHEIMSACRKRGVEEVHVGPGTLFTHPRPPAARDTPKGQ